jgi:hypothetical protein
MTVQLAEDIIGRMSTGVGIALRHRFGGDKGTILRLDNYAMVNIFDDGRYYIQGDNTEELVLAFGIVEPAWDPESWSGVIGAADAAVEKTPVRVGPRDSGSRFEF